MSAATPLQDGPAFPFESKTTIYPGMMLRDYFAAKAMAAAFAGPGARTIADRDDRYDETNWALVVAANAYEMADTMLAHRVRPPVDVAATNAELWRQSEAACAAQYDKLLAKYDAMREPLRRALLAADNLLSTLDAHQENVGEHLEFDDQTVVVGARADMAFAQAALDGWQ